MEACGNQLLPEEIITDILLRLPVKALLNFSFVCKSWRDLISSPYFIKTHLEISKNSKNYANHNLILFSINPWSTTYTCSLSSILDNNATINLKNLYYPTRGPGFDPWIYGSCNGLLCVRVDSTIVLYNPTTRMSKILPASGTKFNISLSYGLCCYELDDDYRVVEIEKLTDNSHTYLNGVQVKIYSLRTNSWRKINGDVLDESTTYCGLSIPICTGGIPIGGVLHWIIDGSDNSCEILGVDTVTYRYGTLAGPKYVDTGRLTHLGIIDFRGCIGVFHTIKKTGVDIWIKKESWTKVLSVPYGVGPMGYQKPMIGLKGGQILFVKNEVGYLLVYDSTEGSFIEHVFPDICPPYFYASPSQVYIESLVVPSF